MGGPNRSQGQRKSGNGEKTWSEECVRGRRVQVSQRGFDGVCFHADVSVGHVALALLAHCMRSQNTSMCNFFDHLPGGSVSCDVSQGVRCELGAACVHVQPLSSPGPRHKDGS